jgi:chorismate dehydratase
MTGLPFVFAAWISNKKLDEGWVRRFDQANEFGLKNISRVIEEMPAGEFDLKKYFTSYLSYELDNRKQRDLIFSWNFYLIRSRVPFLIISPQNELALIK